MKTKCGDAAVSIGRAVRCGKRSTVRPQPAGLPTTMERRVSSQAHENSAGFFHLSKRRRRRGEAAEMEPLSSPTRDYLLN